MSSVPTIDLRHLNTVALASLDAACRDHGFFRLKGHGLDDLMDDM